MTQAPLTVGKIVPLGVSPLPSGPPQIVEPPLSPRLRVLIVAFRRALLIVYDGLGEYAGLEKREVGVK